MSEPVTDPQQQPTAPAEPQDTPQEPAQAQSADTDWKSEARKWEQRAKDNLAKLREAEPIVSEWQRLQEASKTELERAQEAAKAAEERAASTLHRVAAAEVKAALTGVVSDPSALLEDLNISRFINGEGEVDAGAITALRDKYAALAPAQSQPRMQPNPAQGTSSTPPLGMREQIAQAEKAGDMKTAFRLKAQQAVQDSTANQ